MQLPKYAVRLFGTTLALACLARWMTAAHAIEPPHSPSSAQIAVGDVVDQLGDNLTLVHQDLKNQWWFATWSDGLYRFDGKSIVHYTTKHGLSHNRTDQIVEDSQGNLYFNTMGGISRFDGEKFNTLPVSLFSTWQLMPGDLWFKTPEWDGSVLRYDGQRLHRLQLPKVKAAEDYAAKHPYPRPYGVYFVYRDKADNVWFGTAATGVCRYDGKSFEWLTSSDVTEFHDGPSNGVRSILEDHEGHFWFNTRYRYELNLPPIGFSAAAPAEGIFRRLPGIGRLGGRSDGDYEFMSIAQDQEKNIWIASGTDGVFRYDGKELKHYPIHDGEKSVRLFTVYCDRAGTIWLGTHENGAFRFTGSTFERFNPGGNQRLSLP